MSAIPKGDQSIPFTLSEENLIKEFDNKTPFAKGLMKTVLEELKPYGHSIQKTKVKEKYNFVWEAYAITNSSRIPQEQLQRIFVKSTQENRWCWGVEVSDKTDRLGNKTISILNPSDADWDLFGY